MEITDLKHGQLSVKLLLCNKALRLATMSVTQNLGVDESVFVSGNTLATSELLYSYAFFSYKMYCQKHREHVLFDEFDFDDLIRANNVKKIDSNLEDVLTLLADSLISTITENVETIKSNQEIKKKIDG